MIADRDYALIDRTTPKPPDRLEVRRSLKHEVRISLTPGDLFRALGIDTPPVGTPVHILLARSHGNEGSFYGAGEAQLVVEVRMTWELHDGTGD